MKVRETFFTWSNFISLSRVLVVFPIIYLHYQNDQHVTSFVTGLIGYAFVSDYLDGFVARKLDEISEWGKMLDPIADKLAAFFLFGYTVYIGLIPLWFFIVEIVRDLLILGGSFFIRIKKGKVAMAVMSGKWGVNALAFYWMSAFFFPEAIAWHHFFMGIALVLMAFSLVDYYYRFSLISRGAEFN